jgi:PAS domain S-box-containing protein
MKDTMTSHDMTFLSGGGEMGELTRSRDWSVTSVGNPENWPQSLRTTISIILNSGFPMFLWWGPELLCFYNDAYRPSLGINGKHPSILGMKAEEAWPEIWAFIKPLIRQVMSGGDAVYMEDQLVPIYRNGRMEDVYWTFSYSAVNDESGKAAGVLVTCFETTDKISGLKRIEESEERFRTMAESSKILISMGDESSNATYFNKAWMDITGKSLKNLLEYGWADLIHPEDKERQVHTYLSAFEKRSPFAGEFRILDSTGKYRWLSVKGAPRFHSDASFAGYIASCTDITEEKLAQEQLKQSESRFRMVANDAPVMIWMSDHDKNYNFFNSEWLNYTGKTAKQEYGNGWIQGLHPEDFERCQKTRNAAFDKKEDFHIEYRLKRYDGEYRWLSDKGTPHFAANGTFEGYIGACMEIHENIISQAKIKESEERLNIVIEASELGIWELNLKNSDIWYSGKYSQILGVPEDKYFEHKELVKRIHPDDLAKRDKAIADALETGNLNYETRLIWDDGSIRWVEGKGKVFYDAENNPEKMIGTIRDITTEKNHEREIMEREQKFRLLADSMPQHIWTADTQGNLDYFNKSVFKYSGLTRELIDELGWLEIIHPDDREENMKLWNAAISNGEDFLFEHRFRRHDGVYRWQLSRAIPNRDKDGTIRMWVGTSTDIEDQKLFANQLEEKVRQRTKELKKLNESLKKSEQRYHLMVEEVQDYAIIYLNPQGTVENWNKGAEKIKGYTAEEIIGKDFSTFYTASDKESGLPQYLLSKATTTGRAGQEGWRVRKDGTVFWASVVITAVHNESNQIIGFSKVTHDLTEKKQAADALEANAAQLEHKNIQLQKMNKELESFAYISSHDLQEPLRKIQTFSSRILEKDFDKLSEDTKDNFLRMQSAAGRMQTLIEDLLAYSRTNNSEKKYVHTDLKKLIDEVRDDLSEELEKHKAILDVRDMCHCPVIPFQFRQLMQNLITNSIKFAREGIPPHIIIESETKPGKELKNEDLIGDIVYCHVSITDNGIGFEVQYSRKIFEVFQRLHGKTEYVGTGIGLAIVKKIVENHNGIITATGEPDQGARFDIYFPVHEK